MADRRRRGATATTGAPDPQVLLSTAPEVMDNLRYLVGRWKLQRKGGVPRRLGLTATLRGEGVTYLTQALATVLAHDLERSVCVVDLDWWSTDADPAQPAGAGLAGVLRGDTPVDAALQLDGSGLLWRLPAGAASADERPVLAQSSKLEPLIEELHGRFDHVLLDLPALRSAGESLTLAGLSEECILVVRQGVTTLDQVRVSVEQLEGVQLTGVILNKNRNHVPRAVLKRIAS